MARMKPWAVTTLLLTIAFLERENHEIKKRAWYGKCGSFLCVSAPFILMNISIESDNHFLNSIWVSFFLIEKYTFVFYLR